MLYCSSSSSSSSSSSDTTNSPTPVKVALMTSHTQQPWPAGSGRRRRQSNVTTNATNSSGYLLLLFGIAIFVMLMGLGNAADNLRCYKCTVAIEIYKLDDTVYSIPMCSKFAETEEYMTDCPYSTMCLKSISILHLQNGQKQETVTRRCAQQKNTTQVFRNNSWQQQHSVQEVYEEGCREIKVNSYAGSKTIHCYCRGDLCNSSNFLKLDCKISFVIYVFSALRLLLNYSNALM